MVSNVRFPAASTTETVITFVPGASGMSVAVQALVPVAGPLPPRSFDQVTDATGPSASEAVPARVTKGRVQGVDAADVGDVMVTAGRAPAGCRISKNSTLVCVTRTMPPTEIVPG